MDGSEANLLKWIDQFREYLRVANRPQTTIRAYCVALRQFQGFARDRDLTVDAAIDFAQQLHVASVAKTNYLAAVSRFYRFLIARGMIEISNRDWERFREFRHDLGRHGTVRPTLRPKRMSKLSYSAPSLTPSSHLNLNTCNTGAT